MTMLDEIRHKIDEEMGRLEHELTRELPERIRIAVELGDLKENAEYKSALERQQFVQARMSHLAHRQSDLSQIDVENLPLDRVGFGSKVSVEDLEVNEVFDFTIVAGDFMDLDGDRSHWPLLLVRGCSGLAKTRRSPFPFPGESVATGS